MDALIQFGIFICLLAMGFFFGRRAEKKHYQRIFERENQYRSIVITTERMPSTPHINHDSQLVMGSVVISVDYFKVVVAGLKQIIGGRLTTYESLLDRARREALIRMQEQAFELGAEAVINTKFETSRVAANAGNGLGSMEVLAYGTALTRPKNETNFGS